jgi:hypothetical protein
MAIQTITIPPLDPNIFTGPTRNMSGVGRTFNPTLDVAYGTNGAVEFMRWLYVGTSGNITYTKWDGTQQTLVGIGAGIWHPIYSIMINNSGTTASDIVVGS